MEYTLFIKKFRVEKNFTQLQLAQKSKVKQSYISQLENNADVKSPTLRTIFNIAKALGVCPHMLIQYNTTCDKNCIYICHQKKF